MSESSGSSSGPGCITIIICVIVGIALYKGCEEERPLYTSKDRVSQDLQSPVRLHENIRCPVLEKEQPDPDKIRKATPDDKKRKRCSLCSDEKSSSD